MSTEWFDYVIVGGGAAGCVLAARLSEDSTKRILLLEAGPAYRGLPIHIPASIGDLYTAGQFHWDYLSAPEPFANDRQLPYKMGRILGGSSAINGLVWVRGHPSDFDDWEAEGCTGWGWRDVAPFFQSIERNHIHITCPNTRNSPLNTAFLTAAQEAGFSYNSDYNDGDQDGACHLRRNTKHGRRIDAYEGYLKPVLSRKNLEVRSNTQVVRLDISDGRISGAVVRHGDTETSLFARQETILAAGALGSPKILELSGIGDQAVLSQHGIRTAHILPGVGRNFHTHPTIRVRYRCETPVSVIGATRGLGRFAAGLRWLLLRDGPAASNQFETGAFVRTDASLRRPDAQLTFLPLALSSLSEPAREHGFQIYTELIGCHSRGETHIANADPTALPTFWFNFLEREEDRSALRTATRFMRNIVSQPAFTSLRGEELEPGAIIQDDQALDDWLRETVSVSHHLCGSCRMGRSDDPGTVVTPDLRLKGLAGLRIADTSIMPRVVSGNTHAAALMIAEKAADLILSTATTS